MASYLKFSSSDGALERSKELWEEHLGHPVEEGATTQFLYSVVATSTESYLIIADDGEMPFSAFFSGVVYHDRRTKINPLDDEELTENALVQIGSACRYLPSTAPQQLSMSVATIKSNPFPW